MRGVGAGRCGALRLLALSGSPRPGLAGLWGLGEACGPRLGELLLAGALSSLR